MRIQRSIKMRRALVLLFIAGVLLGLTTVVQAKIRTGGGGDLPAYARIAEDEIFHTDEWAAIVFYRPTDCVPEEFNLLEFYDFGAFSCEPPTTDGFIIWAGEPGISAPIQINLHGLGAVPVWFVSWPELETAVADGELTIFELEGMSPLVGSAGFYKETLHPTGGAQVPMIQFNAQGSLADGRSFKVQVILVTVGDARTQITIE